ncbi:MAG: hypothetical protein HGA25_00055 [Clostridiales bacterium]|nr:hypothetical protein [Clostridiales bacterium]
MMNNANKSKLIADKAQYLEGDTVKIKLMSINDRNASDSMNYNPDSKETVLEVSVFQLHY